MTIHEPAVSLVNVETKKKEDRNQKMVQTSFKSFIAAYRKDPVYMVNPVPPHLERDVAIPYSLQCPALVRLFRRDMMWMSSGGTKSVVHIDDYENLNCLIRGEKRLILVDRKKYPKAVPLDRAASTFSSLDVDAVDFIEYPSMRAVGEYHVAEMSAGDCLYIPFKWIHQVRSFGRNIAVNLWWDHTGSGPTGGNPCENAPSHNPNLSLRDIDWDSTSTSTAEEEEEEEEEEDSLKSQLLSLARDDEINFKFLKSVYFDDGFTGRSIFAGASRNWNP